MTSNREGSKQELGFVGIAFFGLAVAGLSFFISATTGAGEWFQRSGSLIVMLAAVVEFRINRISAPNRFRTVFLKGQPNALSKKALKFYRVTHEYALTALIFGTLAWGYGDLLFNREGAFEQVSAAVNATGVALSIVGGTTLLATYLSTITQRARGLLGILVSILGATQIILIQKWGLLSSHQFVHVGALVILQFLALRLIVRWLVEETNEQVFAAKN